MAVKARPEKRRRMKGPSVMDMSISPWPSMLEPTTPRSACRLASSTIRRLKVSLKRIQRITAISSPPANSAPTNCHPRRTRRTSPSSKTRFVAANSKMIALTKLAPRRKSVRATATAAYEQLELAAPKAHARAKPFRSDRPRARATAPFDTTVSTMAERRKPRASGHSTSHNMKKDAWRARETASTTNTSAPHEAADGLVELADLLGSVPRLDRLRHAVLGVISEQLKGDALEGGPGGADLGQDVDAVAVLFDHLLDTPDLALDPSEPGLDAPLVLCVAL